jgi:hypothetical protein
LEFLTNQGRWPATRKVEETIFRDDPVPDRHPLTAYV